MRYFGSASIAAWCLVGCLSKSSQYTLMLSPNCSDCNTITGLYLSNELAVVQTQTSTYSFSKQAHRDGLSFGSQYTFGATDEVAIFQGSFAASNPTLPAFWEGTANELTRCNVSNPLSPEPVTSIEALVYNGLQTYLCNQQWRSTRDQLQLIRYDQHHLPTPFNSNFNFSCPQMAVNATTLVAFQQFSDKLTLCYFPIDASSNQPAMTCDKMVWNSTVRRLWLTEELMVLSGDNTYTVVPPDGADDASRVQSQTYFGQVADVFGSSILCVVEVERGRKYKFHLVETANETAVDSPLIRLMLQELDPRVTLDWVAKQPVAIADDILLMSVRLLNDTTTPPTIYNLSSISTIDVHLSANDLRISVTHKARPVVTMTPTSASTIIPMDTTSPCPTTSATEATSLSATVTSRQSTTSPFNSSSTAMYPSSSRSSTPGTVIPTTTLQPHKHTHHTSLTRAIVFVAIVLAVACVVLTILWLRRGKRRYILVDSTEFEEDLDEEMITLDGKQADSSRLVKHPPGCDQAPDLMNGSQPEDQQHLIDSCPSTTQGTSATDERLPIFHAYKNTATSTQCSMVSSLQTANAAQLRHALSKESTPTELAACMHMLAQRCASAQPRQILACINVLQQNGHCLEAVDDRGRTPLLLAAYCGNHNGFTALIAAGADPTVVDDNGQHVLSLSCQSGSVEQLKALLTVKGALKPLARDSGGRSALHWLVATGTPSMLYEYLELDLPLDVQDHHGNTCWHYVAEEGQTDLIQPLMAARRNQAMLLLYQKNHFQQKPIDLARSTFSHATAALQQLTDSVLKPGETEEQVAFRLRRAYQARNLRLAAKAEGHPIT
eukprot:m.138240 g.138240  ORF g.138240 m.138240 type:complete len:835 (-) comp16066_c0_seq5:186-2690(-)